MCNKAQSATLLFFTKFSCLKQASFIACVYVKDEGLKLLAAHVSILSYCSQLIHQNVQYNSDDADPNINITGQF